MNSFKKKRKKDNSLESIMIEKEIEEILKKEKKFIKQF